MIEELQSLTGVAASVFYEPALLLLLLWHLEDVQSVVLQLFDALPDVLQGSVGGRLLGHHLVVLWKPPSAELLDGANIYYSVVEVVHELRHILVQEPLVRMHGVPSEGTLSGRGVLPDEGQELVLGLFQGDLTVHDGPGQPGPAVVQPTPLRHAFQQFFWLIDDQVGPLSQNLQVGVCNNARHFNDLVLLDVQTRHLQVHPHDPVGHRGGRHAAIAPQAGVTNRTGSASTAGACSRRDAVVCTVKRYVAR